LAGDRRVTVGSPPAAAHLTPAAASRWRRSGSRNHHPVDSSWPDQIRRQRRPPARGNYIDIPIGQAHLDMTRGLPPRRLRSLPRSRNQEGGGGPGGTAVERKKPSMFLVHFVGDMPSRCMRRQQGQGRQRRQARLLRANSNLHSAWDSGYWDAWEKEDELFARFSADLTEKRAKEWGKGLSKRGGSNPTGRAEGGLPENCRKLRTAGLVKVDARTSARPTPSSRRKIEKAGRGWRRC